MTYNPDDDVWMERKVRVFMAPKYFEKGAMRAAFKMAFDNCKHRPGKYVAKLALKSRDRADTSLYERDVKMQMVAKQFSTKYNALRPPKKVDFLEAFLLKLMDREGQPIVAVEQFVPGEYVKYNNNWDWAEDKRNTPQSFSHWTYVESKHTLLICDIQGVGDMWTDPQIHTAAPTNKFGKGNMFAQGISVFLQSHECNGLCRWLKLPPTSRPGKSDAMGTVAPDTHAPGAGPSKVPQMLQPAAMRDQHPPAHRRQPDGFGGIPEDEHLVQHMQQLQVSGGQRSPNEDEEAAVTWTPGDVNRVRVVVLAARDLVSKQMVGTGSNSFVELQLGKNKRQTKIIPSTCSPSWVEPFYIPYTAGFEMHETLQVRVMHKDKLRDARHLGTLHVQMSSLKDGPQQSHAEWFKLSPLEKSNVKERGEIFLSICRYPTQFQDSLPSAVPDHIGDVPDALVGAAATHNWKQVFFKKPTWCDICRKFFWGVIDTQGKKCSNCKMVVHNDCLKNVTSNCTGEGQSLAQTFVGTPGKESYLS